MVTTASKLYFGASFAALVAAWAYAWGNDGGLLGAISFGLRGGVGTEVNGYIILVFVSLALLVLGITASILRDADPEVTAAAARLETLPPAIPPANPSYWPMLGAAGVVTMLVGLVASPALFVIGCIGTGLVMLEWMVQAWSERATGDPAVNRKIRNRLMYPIEIPVAGALAVLILVVSVSRVLLATSATASWIIAAVVATIIFVGAVTFAYRPSIGKDAIAAILLLFMALAIGGGIAAAAVGAREFHHDAGAEEEAGAPAGGELESSGAEDEG